MTEHLAALGYSPGNIDYCIMTHDTEMKTKIFVVKTLQQEIDACNREGGMHIQLITNEPEAFQAGKPTYGQFKGCRNYLAIVGPKGKDVEAGYYGERVVLKAQELGINSCWVALTYKKGKAQGMENAGEKRYLVVQTPTGWQLMK